MAKLDTPVQDRGCERSPHRVDFIGRQCAKEMRASRRKELVTALKIVQRELAKPDQVLAP